MHIYIYSEWQLHYAAFLEYYKQHGNCEVPVDCIYECDLQNMDENEETYDYKDNLGAWLNQQKIAFKEVAGETKMTSKQIDLLQQLIDEGNTSVLTYCQSL